MLNEKLDSYWENSVHEEIATRHNGKRINQAFRNRLLWSLNFLKSCKSWCAFTSLPLALVLFKGWNASGIPWGLRPQPLESLPSAISTTALITSHCKDTLTCLSPSIPHTSYGKDFMSYSAYITSNGWHKESGGQIFIQLHKPPRLHFLICFMFLSTSIILWFLFLKNFQILYSSLIYFTYIKEQSIFCSLPWFLPFMKPVLRAHKSQVLHTIVNRIAPYMFFIYGK